MRSMRPSRTQSGFLKKTPYLILTSTIQIVILLSYLPPNTTRPLFTALATIYNILKKGGRHRARAK